MKMDEPSVPESGLGGRAQARARIHNRGKLVMDTTEITREKRLRRAAARQGLRLTKSARRDPYANDYGKYRVENPRQGGVVVAGGSPFDYSLNLDQVEDVLFPDRHRRHDHPLRRDEDYENAITPHAPHDGDWAHRDESR
jgi:hypothetical protein